MKMEYYQSVIKMLRAQLQEEEEGYEQAVHKNKQFWQLEEIRQRIKSLQATLYSLTTLNQTVTKQLI